MNKKFAEWFVLSLVLLISLGISACGGSGGGGGGGAGNHNISGVVSGATQSGVTITLSGDSTATTTTDASGNYRFAGISGQTFAVTPSKEGYVFDPPVRTSGPWLHDEDITDVNFTAYSSANSTYYTVTYYANGATGGSAPTDTTNYQQGQTVTVLGNTGNLVKTGSSFSGWNTAANGSGTTYTQGQTFAMGSANVTLYAMWTASVAVPAAPTNLAITGITQTGATIAWTDNSSNETRFEVGNCTGVETGDTNGNYWCESGFSKIGDALTNATSYALTGLTAGTQYKIYVRACNSAGCSDAPDKHFTTSSGSQTVTLSPQYDNCLEYDGYSSSYANTAYPNCTVPIGVNWYTDVVNYCVANPAYAAVVKFNLSTLAGKTIDSATLKLTATSVSVGYYPQNFKIYAVATSWNPSTVTWNIAANFSVYTSLTENYPTYAGEIYNINLQTIVQNWANGSYANNGLAFESTTYSLCPGVMSFDAYEFASPSLIVTYH
jgi:hypothetical protein